MSRLRSLFAFLAVTIAGAGLAAAQQVGQTVIKRGTVAEDLYLAGGTVEVRADVRGDVLAAGGRVVVEQRVEGDVIAVGGMVDIAAEVLDDVRAAGGTVYLRGRYTGDAVATGGTVELGPDASVGGRAWFGGGTVSIAGRVGTRLKVAAERVTLAGTVEGNVDLAAREIVILPTARITGALTYRSREAAVIDPAAQIAGGVTRLPYQGESRLAGLVGSVWFIAATGLLGALLVLAFPIFASRVGTILQDNPWKSLGLGAAALIGGPVAAIVLLITVVGAAVGVLTLVVYAIALLLGFLAGAKVLGGFVLRLLRPGAPATVGMAIVGLLLGLVALALLGLVPVVGTITTWAALLVGLGALVIGAYRAWRDARTLTTA